MNSLFSLAWYFFMRLGAIILDIVGIVLVIRGDVPRATLSFVVAISLDLEADRFKARLK